MKHQEIVDALRGSSKGLTVLLMELDREDLLDDKEFTDLLDSQLFCCAECDWWCDQDERANGDEENEEPICQDCGN